MSELQSYSKMKNTVMWDVAPCSLVEAHQHFGGTYWLHLQGKSSRQPAVSLLLLAQLTV